MSVARFCNYHRSSNFPTRLSHFVQGVNVNNVVVNNVNYKKFRCFSNTAVISQKRQQESQNLTVSNVKDTAVGPLTIGEKVKQTTKDASYLGIIIAGVGITGMMFYAIFRELFSSESPNSIYSSALEKVREDESVINSLGPPIKGFGELSSRGRRRHVSHLEFLKNGVSHMRMKFYVQGTRGRGTVHLEVRKSESGKYDYEYLILELDTGRTLILQDNRPKDLSII